MEKFCIELKLLKYLWIILLQNLHLVLIFLKNKWILSAVVLKSRLWFDNFYIHISPWIAPAKLHLLQRQSLSERVLCMLHCCSATIVPDSLWPYGLWSSRLLCPWDSPGKNTGIGCHALLQKSSWPRDHQSPALAGWFFTISASWEAQLTFKLGGKRQ